MPPPDQHKLQAPKGTRDFYPADLLRRRYIEKAWRDTAIRHGFEEIDGPTFEHTELYTVKSGEAILGEVFGVFSGKDEAGVPPVGRSGPTGAQSAPYALRPEFTPTLARMYAAKAGSLPKPTKWFWQQNCFRAERPQRGRLREFGQWNVDVIGGSPPEGHADAHADADVLLVMIALLSSLGLTPQDVRVRISDRRIARELIRASLFRQDQDEIGAAFSILDARAKRSSDQTNTLAGEVGFDIQTYDANVRLATDYFTSTSRPARQLQLLQHGKLRSEFGDSYCRPWEIDHETVSPTMLDIIQIGFPGWCTYDFGIVRGLAYYTGMVFEVHEASGAERAIAGGGRYDGLIELFGGPPTPAVGFGMGDVVLANILADRGLMPEGKALLDKLSEPAASLRPDVFVIANEREESQSALRPLVATLRREGLHARHSYKATKTVGKLLKEASDSHARFAAIIESGSEATLKNLDDRSEQKQVSLADIAARARR